MELMLSDGFYVMSLDETEQTNGGGAVEAIVNGVVSIYDSWCDMWHECGKNFYYYTH